MVEKLEQRLPVGTQLFVTSALCLAAAAPVAFIWSHIADDTGRPLFDFVFTVFWVALISVVVSVIALIFARRSETAMGRLAMALFLNLALAYLIYSVYSMA